MASTGDAIAGAEATKRKTKRISDFLGDSDGDEASPPSPKTPPRLRLPKFTCARIRFVRLGRKRGGGGGGGDRKEVAAAEKSEAASVDTPGWTQAAGSSSGASVEAGVGLGMLLFLATTCVELNRMAEVRAQMETLLKEIKDEVRKMKSRESEGHVVVTPRTCDLQSSLAATAASSCTSDTNTNCLEIARGGNESKSSEDKGCPGADVLEAEFETEPAQRRPLDCKCNAEEQETPESSGDEFIELDGRFGRGGNFVGGDGDGDDREEDSGGVSAIELERRLHEVLHRRDRERIEELESALRRAQRKLMEKEMEARLWQDTATLALQPPPREGQ